MTWKGDGDAYWRATAVGENVFEAGGAVTEEKKKRGFGFSGA